MEKRQNVLSEKIWRLLTNIWTVVTIGIFLTDYFSGGAYSASSSATGAIYIAILGIFAGTKEFDRWHHTHRSRHYGEVYVMVWTAVIILLCILLPFSHGRYTLASHVIIVYTSVLTIFALTQRSKAVYTRRKVK